MSSLVRDSSGASSDDAPPAQASAGLSGDRSDVARGGAFSLVGAVTSAVMGFVLVVVLGRTLGTASSGVVLQGIAVFTITLAVARFGLDTSAVWILPRLVDGQPQRVRAAVWWLLAPGFILGILTGAALFVAGRVVDGPLGLVLQTMAWGLPAAVLMTIALSATRGLGGVKPYVAVNSIGVPTGRPVLVTGAVAAGLGAAGAAGAWTVMFGVGAVVALVVLARRVRGVEQLSLAGSETWWPQRDLRRQIRSYSLPRSVAVVLEQLMLWIDVILIGALAGPAAAGIYGAATRFVAAGRIVTTSLRIVVAPLYSRMLGRGQLSAVQDLYTTTTVWIVLLSMPIYAMYSTFGGTLLSAMGPGFRAGASVMALLSVGLTITLLGGNLQVLLLMSGMSRRVALYKAVSLSILAVGMIGLVPRLGIEGGAIAWSVAVAVDTMLAGTTVQRQIGVRIGHPSVFLALAVGGLVPAAVAASVRSLMGDGLGGLVTALAVAGVVFLVLTYLLRRRLFLAEIAQLVRRRRSGAGS